MTKFETYLNPFSANSYWNSRPINPVLGSYVIPSCSKPRNTIYKCFPSIAGGAYSTGIFKALPTDPPLTIYKQPDQSGIYHSDSLEFLPSITIPHWPSEAVAAVGSDGHCDIIDEEAGIIHSFWILKKNAEGKHTARQYSWSPITGMGFGDPAHFSQGARAAGVPTCAGMIRKHEVNDGKPLFEHVLACSLDYSGMAASPAYVLPATLSDRDPWTNTGGIPEGALIMLPKNYDTSRLDRWPLTKKVAETLKVYGARVVDRNEYTPYAIYVENGTLTPKSWDNDLAAELDYIRTQLRQVVSTSGYLNGHGQPRTDGLRPNYMSLRGPWTNMTTQQRVPLFNSHKQRLDMPATTAKTTYFNANSMAFRVPEFKPKAGDCFKFWVESNCGAKMNLVIKYKKPDDPKIYSVETGYVESLKAVFLKWPANAWYEIYAFKQVGPAGWVRTRFVKTDEAEYNASTPKMIG